MSPARVSPRLSVWTVISLRVARDQAPVRRLVRRMGGRVLALPALRLAAMADRDAASHALALALACPCVVFTSPAAVRFAATLLPLEPVRGRRQFALGAGTAAALHRCGLHAERPGDDAMRSEGLLALPAFAAPLRQPIGLVTAPGGRGLIAAALRARGAHLCVAEVYRRMPPRFDRRHHAALAASHTPRALLLTSAEALDQALEAFPAGAAAAALRDARVVASSTRLVQHARARGYHDVVQARSPAPGALLDALLRSLGAGAAAATSAARSGSMSSDADAAEMP